MSRESSSDPSLLGYDDFHRPVSNRWPIVEDEPPSPRPHTPVPPPDSRPSTPGSVTSGHEDNFATPTPSPPSSTAPPIGRTRSSSIASTRQRAGTDTDARLLSADSPARSDGFVPTSREISRDPSADSLEWDDSAHAASVTDRGAPVLNPSLLAASLDELAKQYDPSNLTIRGREAQQSTVANFKALSMAAAGGVNAKTADECIAALETAVRVYEDDIEGLQPEQFPTEILRQKWA